MSADAVGGDVWSDRAALYVESDAHRGGEDLDVIVALE